MIHRDTVKVLHQLCGNITLIVTYHGHTTRNLAFVDGKKKNQEIHILMPKKHQESPIWFCV